MPLKVFRFSKFQRYLTLLTVVLLIIITIWFLSPLVNADFFEHAGGRILLIIPYPLGIITFTYLIWVTWAYRIEFWETEIRITSYFKPWKQYERCAYKDMEYIRRPTMRGEIQIISKSKKSFEFLTRVDDGVDALLDELEKHIPLDKFQLNLRSELKKFSKYDKVAVSASFFPLLILMMMNVPSIILNDVAWKTVWEPSYWSSGDIYNFWLNHGTVWISFRRPFVDGINVVRVENDEKSFWKFDGDNFYPYAVLVDNKEQPWMIGHDQLYRWTEASWQGYQFQNYRLRNFSKPIVIENMYWAQAYDEITEKPFLVRINLNSGEITPLYLPNELTKDGFSIWDVKEAPDHLLYVMVTKPNAPVFFYLIKDGQWEEKFELKDAGWALNDMFLDEGFYKEYVARNGEPDPILGVTDFTLDPAGQLWVVMRKEKEFLIGLYDLSTGDWKWSNVAGCQLCVSHYSEIVVDIKGRIWLGGSFGHKEHENDNYSIDLVSGVDVFLPRWRGEAELLRRYTELDSNYQRGPGGNALRISDDGFIWAAGDRVVKIDAKQNELAKPMSGWITSITDHQKFFPMLFVFMGIWFVGTLIWGLVLRFKDWSFPKKRNS